jgi:hypothetical protein
MEKIPETLLLWRESDFRASRSDSRYSREAFDLIRAEYLSKDPTLQQKKNLVFWGAGRKTRKRTQLLIEKGFKPSAWIEVDRKKINQKINGIPVHSYKWLKEKQDLFILSYVNNHGARKKIANKLIEYGYEQGKDFIFVG